MSFYVKKSVGLTFALLLLITLMGCNISSDTMSGVYSPDFVSSSPKTPGPSPFLSEGGTLTSEQADILKAECIISGMGLEQKIGQLFLARVPVSDKLEDIKSYHLGGYILFGRDTAEKTISSLSDEIASYQAASSIPLIIGIDEEGGSVVRLSSNRNFRSSRFLSPQALFAEGGMDRIVSDTAEKDALLKLVGINLNLAPVADVSVNPEDFIYSRSFGQDAKSTAEYVSAVVSQMCADGMGSVLKHFPGYGSNADTHTGSSIDARTLESFRQSDFLPFKSGFSSGGKTVAVMVSHNIMACVDDERPSSLSPAVNEIIRSELGFDGVVMTDDLAMDAVKGFACPALEAIKAGCDMVICTDYKTQYSALLQAVKSGELDEGVINNAVRRIILWKIALGLI